MANERQYWLMKTEPGVYSIDDLKRDGKTYWEGVRNYQARNFIRDEMRPGDKVLFYHSSTTPPGVAGLAEVVSEAYPDPTQFDEASPFFDPKATESEPRWFLVEVRAVRALPRLVSLAEMKGDPALSEMRLVQRGNRLSVMPVREAEYGRVLELAGQ